MMGSFKSYFFFKSFFTAITIQVWESLLESPSAVSQHCCGGGVWKAGTKPKGNLDLFLSGGELGEEEV